jgi:hypothetical protein
MFPLPKIKSRSLSTPPGSPKAVDYYLVGPNPTGEWAGQTGKIAWKEQGIWHFAPLPLDESILIEDEHNIVLMFSNDQSSSSFGQTFGPSGANHATGLVPDPGITSGSIKFLREDATWATPPGVDGNFAGVVSAPGFDAATLNLGTSAASIVNLGTASSTQTINIGTGSGVTTINLGGAGDTVNIAGTLTTVNTTNTAILDKLLTLNKGGAASSGTNVGLEVQENASITGYARTTSDRNGWEIKAPNTAGVLTLTPGASNASVWHSGNFDPTTKAANTVFIASGPTHAAGLVPDPGVAAGATRFLREDATWSASVSDMLSNLVNTEIAVTGTSTATFSKMHVCSGTTIDYQLTLPSCIGNAGKFVGVRVSRLATKLITLMSPASKSGLVTIPSIGGGIGSSSALSGSVSIDSFRSPQNVDTNIGDIIQVYSGGSVQPTPVA